MLDERQVDDGNRSNGNYIMGKDLHKRGIEKYYRENSEKIHCNTRKNITSEIACPVENLLLGL